MNDNKKIKVIAFYLPQFHPTPNNDIWWGKGFTEWTNACKARPLFRGHYQPHIPADLGFYDLRLLESRLAQANMAKEYGIDGFCYYHYWFDEGRQELELPFQEVLNSGTPNFPFMLCWANESWYSKFWNNDSTVSKKLLVEQKYEDENENINHFIHLLKAFKDPRHLTIDGKPMFMIYRPLDFPNVNKFIMLWQSLAKKNGLPGIYFIGQTIDIEKDYDPIISFGFDAVNSVRHYDVIRNRPAINKIFTRIKRFLFPSPLKKDYGKVFSSFIGEREKENNVIPTILPNWDHTPRSGKGGYVLVNSTPHFFAKHIEQVFRTLIHKKNKIAFIKSWNEWGEGNYMEPDLKFGRGYLEELKRIKDEFTCE